MLYHSLIYNAMRTLYEILKGRWSKFHLKRMIWCTDGSFVTPSTYQSSGKTAYGYMLDDNTAVGLKKSKLGYPWFIDGLCKPSFIDRTSTTDGLKNSSIISSMKDYSKYRYPAFHECLSYSNSNVKSYMPALKEVSRLHSSIMRGKMKEDLKKAGLYDQCTYTETRIKADSKRGKEYNWGYIWSSTEADNSLCAMAFRSGSIAGGCTVEYKNRDDVHVIPFFKVVQDAII